MKMNHVPTLAVSLPSIQGLPQEEDVDILEFTEKDKQDSEENFLPHLHTNDLIQISHHLSRGTA